jgi:hypothetical protein
MGPLHDGSGWEKTWPENHSIANSLQWGRCTMAADGSRFTAGPRSVRVASMGPLHDGSGWIASGGGGGGAFMLQWGRCTMAADGRVGRGRGRLRARQLQWGRCTMAADGVEKDPVISQLLELLQWGRCTMAADGDLSQCEQFHRDRARIATGCRWLEPTSEVWVAPASEVALLRVVISKTCSDCERSWAFHAH